MVRLTAHVLITLHLLFLYQARVNLQQSRVDGVLSSPSQVVHSNRSPERKDFLDAIFEKSRVLFQGRRINRSLHSEILTEIEERLDSPYAKDIFRARTKRYITERIYKWDHILEAIMLYILCDSVSIREWQDLKTGRLSEDARQNRLDRERLGQLSRIGDKELRRREQLILWRLRQLEKLIQLNNDQVGRSSFSTTSLRFLKLLVISPYVGMPFKVAYQRRVFREDIFEFLIQLQKRTRYLPDSRSFRRLYLLNMSIHLRVHERFDKILETAVGDVVALLPYLEDFLEEYSQGVDEIEKEDEISLVQLLIGLLPVLEGKNFDHFTTIIKLKKWITRNFDSLNRLIIPTQEREVNKPQQALAGLSFEFPDYIEWNQTAIPSDELLFNDTYYAERERVIFAKLIGLSLLKEQPHKYYDPSLVSVRYNRLLKAIDQIRWAYSSFTEGSGVERQGKLSFSEIEQAL